MAVNRTPKWGSSPPPEHIVRIHTTYKWLKFKHLRHDSFYVKNVIHIFVLTMRRPWNHFRSRQIAIESRFGLAVAYAHRCRKRIAIAAIMPKGTRIKSAIRMPIAMPLRKRVTTGWHSHESREPFVEFHGFQSPGGSPRGVSSQHSVIAQRRARLLRMLRSLSLSRSD